MINREILKELIPITFAGQTTFSSGISAKEYKNRC